MGLLRICAFLLTFGSLGLHAADSDALTISARIQARHVPFGTILDPIFDSPTGTGIVGYTRCGDSAIWTGHYLAAESFRYAVTRSPDALANVKSALAGLKGLTDVTGYDLLARCMVPISSPFAAGISSEEAGNGVYTNRSAGLIWVGNTSRDQFLGAMFGLGVAFDLVNDAGVRASAADLISRLVAFLTARNWSIVMPDGSVSTTFLIRPEQQLALLDLARHVNPSKFASTADSQHAFLSGAMGLPILIDTTGDDSYFKFNLDFITFYHLARLESGVSRSAVLGVYQGLRNHTAKHLNAFFDTIDRAVRGPDPLRDQETLALLNDWLMRGTRDKEVNLAGQVAVCGNQACQPIPVVLRVPTDFLWQRSPFQLAGGGSGLVESAGIDYILPYWMSRYYAMGAPFRVQSAASGDVGAAPDSLVSLFGVNLAVGTDRATSIPLPESLQGVKVAVRDSQGVTRAAPILFVSPGQINLLVPAGSAAGDATFALANPGGTQTATAAILSSAPALFTMSGSGFGVAAATAIRISASTTQVPVEVFQCDTNGCAASPIDVGNGLVVISLYGTGLRGAPTLTATVGGLPAVVQYAGAQPTFPGLDQVNLIVPAELKGRGEVNVAVATNGLESNVVTIKVR